MAIKPNQGKIQCRLSVLIAEKELSEGQKYSLRDIEKITGISKTVVAKWINDKVVSYNGNVLAAFCNFLDKKPGDLLHYLPASPIYEQAEMGRVVQNEASGEYML